jgi:hypothetical protein
MNWIQIHFLDCTRRNLTRGRQQLVKRCVNFLVFTITAILFKLFFAGNQEAEGEGDQAARTHLRVHPNREAPLLDAACDAEGVRRRFAKVLPVGQRARQNVPAPARPYRDSPVVPA